MPDFDPAGARRRLFACLLALGLAPLPGHGAELDDYAFKAGLEGNGQDLQSVDLPSDILVALTRADGADIAVFNADGQRLPQRLARRPERIESRRVELQLHAFERFVEQSEKRVTRREVNRDENGLSELSITETVPVGTTGHRYLVDLRVDGESRRFDRLELEWSQQPAEQLLELRLEVGDDLGRMRPLDTPAVISNAAGGDTEWRSIANIDGSYRYLSLMPAGEIERFELRRVVGHYRSREPAPRVALAVTPEPADAEGKRFYRVALPWAVRPAALAIRPTESNRMLVAELYLSRGDEPRRLLRRRVRQHSFDPARAEPAAPIDLPRGDFDSLWIGFDEPPAETPVIELLFEPRRLYFLGDGRRPYTLAWGNYQSGAPGDDLGALLGGSSAERLRDAAPAGIGPTRVAGGDQRLTPRPPLPWKKWLLWALLIGAALVTARMAITLYREMNAGPSSPSD